MIFVQHFLTNYLLTLPAPGDSIEMGEGLFSAEIRYPACGRLFPQKEIKMKRISALLMALILIFAFTACGRKAETPPTPAAEPAGTPAPTETEDVPETPVPTLTPTPEPVPLIPDLPEVHDAALEAILSDVLLVYPGAAGSSLRGAACASRLLDWGMVTELSDDGIYSATGCFLDTLGDQDLLLFFESLDTVYNMGYNLRGENAEGILADAGVENCGWPWNDQAFHALEMIYLGCGAR